MVESSDYELPVTDLSDHDEQPASSILDAASQHHADAKPSNKPGGNNMLKTRATASYVSGQLKDLRSRTGTVP